MLNMPYYIQSVLTVALRENDLGQSKLIVYNSIIRKTSNLNLVST